MRAFYSDTFVLPLPETHRFPMAKYRLLRERLIAEHVLAASEMSVPEPISWDDLRLVHTDAYLEAVASGCLSADAQRRIGFPWSPAMVERSRRSVGATLAAAREALGTDGMSANLAGGTHHAFADRGEGYCVFNDVAVAARVLQREGMIGRALVIDCDVHQGNGTAAIFHGDDSVFTLSLHGAKNFPFQKETSDRDIEFDDGTADEEYLAALIEAVPAALDSHAPDLVFYVAGADPYEGDRLGRLRLTVGGLAERDRIVFDACSARRRPVAVTMGGGYAHSVDAIVTIHVNTIKEAVCHSSIPARRRRHSA